MKYAIVEEIQRQLKFQLESHVARALAIVEDMLKKLNVNANGQEAGHEKKQLAERILEHQVELLIECRSRHQTVVIKLTRRVCNVVREDRRVLFGTTAA